MIRAFVVLIMQVLVICFSHSQHLTNYISPVKHPIQLSGTFGELRTSHFHEGIDIRSSNGRVGDPLNAVNDGYISRVKIDSDGYGNVLFITHPDGLTSVYAHLDGFENKLSDFIEDYQYQNKTFLLDISLDSIQFPVNQGDFIAYMGTTGRSYGPHLHFEIVDSSESKIINPKLLGIQPVDQSAPIINKILINGFTSENVMTDSIVYSEKELKGDTCIISGDKITISLHSFDRANSANKNGVYMIETYVDSNLFTSLKFDSLRFSDTRYYEEIIDYRSYKNGNKFYSAIPDNFIENQKLYKANPQWKKLIQLDNSPKTIKIIVQDFVGNTRELNFTVKKKENIAKAAIAQRIVKETYNANQSYVIDNDPIYYKIDASSFVSDTEISVSHHFDYFNNQKVKVVAIENSQRALLKPIQFSYKTDTVQVNQSKPNCLVQIDNKKTPKFLPLKTDSIWLRTELPEWGEYILYNDKSAPTIQPEYSKKTFRKGERIRFTLDDNLKAIHRSDYLKYNAAIDGEWVLFQYDYKNRSIYHVVGDRTPRGKVTLTLVVTDALGNSATFEEKLNLL